jgi:multisubunit Na+/H+ antiporter MnhB subunit
MNSQILHISARFIKPLFILLSLYVLYRGHNLPGGGFIGGLLAASGYIFYMMAFDVKTTLDKMLISPQNLMPLGLLLAFGSGFFAVLNGEPFMTGRWITVLGIKLGTPTLFDVGVYLTVIGVVITIMSSILQKYKPWE